MCHAARAYARVGSRHPSGERDEPIWFQQGLRTYSTNPLGARKEPGADEGLSKEPLRASPAAAGRRFTATSRAEREQD
jgi:hypothetical protein